MTSDCYYNNDENLPADFNYGGWNGTQDFRKYFHYFEELSIISAFGVETILGVTGYTESGRTSALLFQKSGECVYLNGYRQIAVAGNGFVAMINDGIHEKRSLF